jgi:hypothetical protein
MLTVEAGELSGDLFVTMKSGDVKRGADVQILAIPRTAAFEAEWAATVRACEDESAPAYRAYKEAKARYQEAFKLQLQGRPADIYAIRRTEEASSDSHNKFIEWLRILRKHEERAEEVIAKHASQVTRTDVNGHYELSVPDGAYYIFSKHRVFKDGIYWMVPVELVGVKKVSLSNSNAGWPIQ